MSDYSIGELAAAGGVSPRTVRYYVAQGLLPGPSGFGPSARYGETHLRRLRLIRQLQARHLPLAEIRTRIGPLHDGEIEALAGERRVAESALDYVRSVLGDTPDEVRGEARSAARSDYPSVASALARRSSVAAGPVAPASGAAMSIRAGDALEHEVPRAAPAMAAPAREPSLPLERSQWDRIALSSNVELHVRRPLGRLENRRVERLISLARDLLKEDPE